MTLEQLKAQREALQAARFNASHYTQVSPPELSCIARALDEQGDVAHPLSQRPGAGLAIVLAAQKAPALCDQPNHGVERRHQLLAEKAP